MSALDDIYYALQAGMSNNTSLQSWVRGPHAYDRVKSDRDCIQRGIISLEQLRAELRDGRKHIEPPDDYKATSCSCFLGNAPCSWCTREIGVDEE